MMHFNQKTNNGIGQEVLLVHGNSLDLGTYSAQLLAPELAHLHLVAIDLPGHGESAPFPTNKNYTLENMAAEVAGVVRAMNDPVLVGHSLGGHICMRVLAQVKNVRALVLFGSPPLSGAADLSHAFLPAPALVKAFQAALTEEDAIELATAYTWPENPRIPEMANLVLATDPRIRSSIGAQMATGDLVNEQEIIRNGPPVCMMHGAFDPFVSISFLEVIATGLFWQDKIHVLPNSGHSPQLQQPAEFNSILDQFIIAISA